MTKGISWCGASDQPYPALGSDSLAVEVPHAMKECFGLDVERSWVVLAEASRFVWLRPDLRMRTGPIASTPGYYRKPL